MFDYGHSGSNLLQMLQIDLSSRYASRQRILQLPNHFPPWINNDGVTIAFPLLIVPACLSCSYYLALTLHSTST